MFRLLIALVLLNASSLAAAFDGEYSAMVDGAAARMQLETRNGHTTGRYQEGSLLLTVEGRATNGRLDARLVVPQTGQTLATLSAVPAGTGLDAELIVTHPLTGARHVLSAQFVPVSTGATSDAPSIPTGSRDAQLVGTWVHENIINSGGADFASFSTVMTMDLRADGQVTQTNRSVGGGGDWSYDSGDSSQDYRGQWLSQDGVLMVRLDGMTEFAAAARFRFDGAYLITENAQGRLIWQRR
jgi:hypothetical protein